MTEFNHPTVPPTPPSAVMPGELAEQRWPAVYTLIALYLLGGALMWVWQAYTLLRGLGAALPPWFLMTAVPVLPLLLEVPAFVGLVLQRGWGRILGVLAASMRIVAPLVLSWGVLTAWSRPYTYYYLGDIVAVNLLFLGYLAVYGMIIWALVQPRNNSMDWAQASTITVRQFIAILLIGLALVQVPALLMLWGLVTNTEPYSRALHASITISPTLAWSTYIIRALVVPALLVSGLLMLLRVRAARMITLGALVLSMAGVLLWSVNSVVLHTVLTRAGIKLAFDVNAIWQYGSQLLGGWVQLIAMIVFLLREGKAQHA